MIKFEVLIKFNCTLPVWIEILARDRYDACQKAVEIYGEKSLVFGCSQLS